MSIRTIISEVPTLGLEVLKVSEGVYDVEKNGVLVQKTQSAEGVARYLSHVLENSAYMLSRYARVFGELREDL